MNALDGSIRSPEAWQNPMGEQGPELAGPLLDALPIAVCVCSRDGRIVRFNPAAAALWGHAPKTGEPGERYCGFSQSSGAGGQSPLAEVLATGVPVHGREVAIERLDGVRVAALGYVTPLFDAAGNPAGALTVLADLPDRQQALLLREVNHRIKNLFTVAGSIVALSAQEAGSVQELARRVQDRLAALARAQDLTLSMPSQAGMLRTQAASLHALIKAILLPFEEQAAGDTARVSAEGPDLPLGPVSVTSFALLLHEFSASAAKYGALSQPGGRVHIECSEDDARFTLSWKERGGPQIAKAGEDRSFASVLMRAIVSHQLESEIVCEWKPEGLTIRLSFDKSLVAA